LVDADRVLRRLERLEQLIEALEAARADGREALGADVRQELHVEHALQLAIQVCIDVGAHLVSELGLPTPDDYREIFEALSRAQLIDAGLAARLGEAAGRRYLLVHEYVDIDLDKVWEALGNLDDLRAFAGFAARQAERG
jgi:uncharacterized protein YutE (UPF0331/DUF86 family)